MGLNVIIVGAGISGLCTAIGLRRAGHSVYIFEKSHFATETGAAVTVGPNGVLVLNHLGFDFVRAEACPLRSWASVDGQTLERIGVQDVADIGRITGAYFWTLHRVDLHKELLRLALDPDTTTSSSSLPVKIQYGSPVRDVDASSGRVYLVDDTVHQADVVIGADGVHSTVRACVAPADSNKQAVDSGLSAFRFLLPSEAILARPDLHAVWQSKDGDSTLFVDTTDPKKDQHMVCYGCRGGRVQNFVGIHPTREKGYGTDTKADMLKQFGHFHPVVREIIQLADDVNCWPLLVHEPLRTWVYDKVLLIGDAAHAMLPFGGQGANQGIEDAGAISVLFRDITSVKDIPRRFSLFEKVRVKRALRVQILSRVRVGREHEVANEVREFLEDGMDIPNTLKGRLVHDSGFDILKQCSQALEVSPMDLT